jgi:hypothetical protein
MVLFKELDVGIIPIFTVRDLRVRIEAVKQLWSDSHLNV